MSERTRSPRYPSMDIEAAVIAVKKIYDKEGRSVFPTESLAIALGHKTLSGAANGKIGSLNQFELIGSEGRGKYRLSETGMTLAVADSESREFRETLVETALTPPIFSELFENYGDASNQTLRHELIVKRGFSSEAADRLISAFRRTTDYIQPFIDTGSKGRADHIHLQNESDSSERQSPDREMKSGSAPAPISFQLRPGLIASVRFNGHKEEIEDIELLKDYLDLHIKGIKRKLAESNSRQEDPKEHHTQITNPVSHASDE